MPLRRLVGAAVVALVGVATAAALLSHSPSDLRELLPAGGASALAVTLCAWVLLTPALFPGMVLAAAGGLAFGVVAGSVLACSGAVLGGVAAFLVARTAARTHVERLVARRARLAALDGLLGRGFAATLAARLTPGVPAGGLHYVAGVYAVPLPAFAAAMALGALLRTMPYAVLGGGLASGSPAAVAYAAAPLGLGAVMAALLTRRLHGRFPRSTPMPA